MKTRPTHKFLIYFSVFLLLLSLVYGFFTFKDPNKEGFLPGQFVYLFIGFIGMLSGQILGAQEKRIAKLEEEINNR